MRAVRLSTLVLALAIIGQSCTHTEAYIVTGETLSTMADQFVDVGDAMNAAWDAGRITPDQYHAWSTFGHNFQNMYPHAVELWKAAVDANDDVLSGQMSKLITDLGADLTGFAAMASAFQKPKPAIDGGV